MADTPDDELVDTKQSSPFDPVNHPEFQDNILYLNEIHSKSLIWAKYLVPHIAVSVSQKLKILNGSIAILEKGGRVLFPESKPDLSFSPFGVVYASLNSFMHDPETVLAYYPHIRNKKIVTSTAICMPLEQLIKLIAITFPEVNIPEQSIYPFLAKYTGDLGALYRGYGKYPAIQLVINNFI